MPSVLGPWEAKESAAREAVERAREEAARIAGVLDDAEWAVERLVFAREAVVEVLAEPVAKAVDVGGRQRRAPLRWIACSPAERAPDQRGPRAGVPAKTRVPRREVVARHPAAP